MYTTEEGKLNCSILLLITKNSTALSNHKLFFQHRSANALILARTMFSMVKAFGVMAFPFTPLPKRNYIFSHLPRQREAATGTYLLLYRVPPSSNFRHRRGGSRTRDRLAGRSYCHPVSSFGLLPSHSGLLVWSALSK